MHFTALDAPLRGSLSLFVRSESAYSPRGVFGRGASHAPQSLLAVRADPGELIDRVLEKIRSLLRLGDGTHAWLERDGTELEGNQSLAGASCLRLPLPEKALTRAQS